MKQNKVLGIILLVLFAAAVYGGIVNGSYENLGNQNIGYCIGFLGAQAALLIFGLGKLFGKKQ